MRTTTLEERVRIYELAAAGHTDHELVEKLGWSVWTVRKWRRRGRQALASVMGRPATGALSTYPAPIRETLRIWRQAHPGWGPKTLRAELAGSDGFRPSEWPSERSIARFLKQEGLPRPYEWHSELPNTVRSTARVPHEEWEMDARGQELVPGVGVVALINLNDCFSGVHLLSYPCLLGATQTERHPATEDYQLALRLAFTQWGLCERLAVDHDSVFYDNATRSPFPTRLHLWAVALGVTLTFGRPNRPTDQGMTERSHQTWYHQVLEGQRFADWTSLYFALQQRRDFLNYQLPCATLGNVPPLVAHPAAATPRRLYRPEWEAELLDGTRIYAYLAQGRWFRRASNVGAVSLGNRVYVLGQKWARRDLEVTFDPVDRHLVFQTADGTEANRLPIKGVTAKELLGEMGPLVGLPAFQLALPFTWAEWRVVRHCDTLGV